MVSILFMVLWDLTRCSPINRNRQHRGY